MTIISKYTVISGGYNNSSSGVNLTPYSEVIFGGSYFNSKKEFKELSFWSKYHPAYWGVKITPKKELSCT